MQSARYQCAYVAMTETEIRERSVAAEEGSAHTIKMLTIVQTVCDPDCVRTPRNAVITHAFIIIFSYRRQTHYGVHLGPRGDVR